MVAIHISLSDLMKGWVEGPTEDVHFANFSNYVRQLTRQDHDHQAALDRLNAALEEDERSGVVEGLDFETFRVKMDAEHEMRC
ncbi:MAG: type II toxin-antitoxin system ParD family antitoxin [Silicimonas sp.]|nr:type II toxin-antitoxin system ParD family antitoxin [Silicimonas sp.]